MMDMSAVGGAGLVVMAMVCPLMMLMMMGMAALPITRRLTGGHGHTMCHMGSGQARHEEDEIEQ